MFWCSEILWSGNGTTLPRLRPVRRCRDAVRINPELDRWRGKIALVTGASSGIGRAIAENFGRLGLKVAVSGRREPALAETATAIRAAGGEACVLVGDQREIATKHALRLVTPQARGAPG